MTPPCTAEDWRRPLLPLDELGQDHAQGVVAIVSLNGGSVHIFRKAEDLLEVAKLPLAKSSIKLRLKRFGGEIGWQQAAAAKLPKQ